MVNLSWMEITLPVEAWSPKYILDDMLYSVPGPITALVWDTVGGTKAYTPQLLCVDPV